MSENFDRKTGKELLARFLTFNFSIFSITSRIQSEEPTTRSTSTIKPKSIVKFIDLEIKVKTASFQGVSSCKIFRCLAILLNHLGINLDLLVSFLKKFSRLGGLTSLVNLLTTVLLRGLFICDVSRPRYLRLDAYVLGLGFDFRFEMYFSEL